MKPSMKPIWRTRFLVIGLLLLAFGLALTSAVQKSPTMDEQNHIARGAAYLGTGDSRLSIEHPPLVNVLSALPAHLLLDLHLPLDTIWWEAAEWYHFADLFLWEVNPNAEQIVFLARLPIIGLGMITATLAFRWASVRFGPWSGVLAAAFCALDPNILAHTRLSTTDVGGTCLVFMAAYALWRTLRRPSWPGALGSGLALGLALSAKLSNLLFVPILGLAVLADGLADGRRNRSHGGTKGRLRRAARNLALLTFAVLLGLLTVWANYGFHVGSSEENGPLVPAPPYVKGVRAILAFSAGGRSGYLLGQYSDQGWWYYFPVAFAVKTPLAALAALLLATWLALRRPRRDDILLLAPPAIYFLASMTSSLNIGYRHLLPVLPFLAVHISRLAQPIGRSSASSPTNRAYRILSVLLVLWLISTTLTIYPHFLAFFNTIGGGPREGWRILVDSNIDWGQDLKELKTWMAREGLDRVRLSWFGSARPEAYGIAYDLLPGVPHGFFEWETPAFNRDQPEPGVYAISVTNLVGVVLPDHDLYAWFREREPDAKAGYSVFIYEVQP
jgi:4-amino-4-deoxy-L-arabinose transferase-like glycosyltransferase